MDHRDTKQAKIAWVMPTYGPIWPEAYSSHLSAMGYASRQMEVQRVGKMSYAGATDRMTLDAAEQVLVHEALNDPDVTHVFMTESDMILPHDTIPKLLELQKPVAGGLYFLRGGSGQSNLFQKVLTLPDNPYVFQPVSVFPVDRPFNNPKGGLHVCFGCVLIERSVFEAIEQPWFLIVNGKHGSDMYFYTKLWQAKIDVWCHPLVRCDQIDYHIVGFKDFEQRLKDDPKFAGQGFMLNGPGPESVA